MDAGCSMTSNLSWQPFLAIMCHRTIRFANPDRFRKISSSNIAAVVLVLYAGHAMTQSGDALAKKPNHNDLY